MKPRACLARVRAASGDILQLPVFGCIMQFLQNPD
jgi:hypothetical protein